MITVTYRERKRGGWGQWIRVDMPAQEAANEVVSSQTKTFKNTKPGDRVVTSWSGTLTELFKVDDVLHPLGIHSRHCCHCFNEKLKLERENS